MCAKQFISKLQFRFKAIRGGSSDQTIKYAKHVYENGPVNPYISR